MPKNPSLRQVTVVKMLLAPALWIICLSTTQNASAGELVAQGAEIKKLAGDFKFTEGPAVDKSGNVFFSDIPNSRIHKWSLEGKLSVFRENTGRANGLYFDKAGNLLACEGGNRLVSTTTPEGKTTTIVSEYNGKKLNSPNDLWIDPKGGIYFTDPRYGSMDDLQQGGFHVYYIAPDRESTIRVIDDLVKPNGIIGTADSKLLYVADPGANKTYRYKINSDATLNDKTLFCESGSDGMTLDNKGNLYLTRRNVLVFDPRGKQIATIETPEGPANVCFGGADRKTLFITARTSFYSIKMKVAGQ